MRYVIVSSVVGMLLLGVVDMSRAASFLDVADTGDVGIGTSAAHVGGGSKVLQNAGSSPTLAFKETDAAANNGVWDVLVNGEQLRGRAINDAGSSDSDWLLINRTGITIDNVNFPNGNVGVGTTSPGAKLHVAGGDAAITTQGNGLILRATDGSNCFRLTVNNSGAPSTSSVTCP